VSKGGPSGGERSDPGRERSEGACVMNAVGVNGEGRRAECGEGVNAVREGVAEGGSAARE